MPELLPGPGGRPPTSQAVLFWSRLGPYHLARARAAAAALQARGCALSLVEVAAADQYAWAPLAPGQDDLRRLTLFPDAHYAQLGARRIGTRVHALLEQLQPRLVLVNGWSVAEARAALRWLGQNRAAVGVVMSETMQDSAPRRWWKEWLKRRVMRHAQGGLVGGAAHADYLAALGIPRPRIALGYDAVDNDYFAAGAAAARADAGAMRARFGLPQRYFLACTRFLPRKNIDGLLRAWAAYRAARGDAAWSLVISGSGECQAALHALARTLQLPVVVEPGASAPERPHVRWAGFLQYPELPSWYGLASAFVHPAKAEPWGLVVNEAAACGLPLLLARPVGAARELLLEGRTGFGFDPFDDASIAAVLARLGDLDEAQRQALGAGAATRVAEYGPQRFASGVLQVLDALPQAAGHWCCS